MKAKAVTHLGACDASAAVTLEAGRFVVANDEDNILRVYRAFEKGEPLTTHDLTPDLGLPPGEEADIEGATRVGGRIFWITSHGTNKKGKARPGRRRLFATNESLAVVDRPYELLVDDLIAAHWDLSVNLKKASKTSPDVGGLNIEGLSRTADGSDLWIGLRSPLEKGSAILIPLLNPNKILRGERARLGEPELLDLDGLGIRAIAWSEARKRYLIIAGAPADVGKFHLYSWKGPGGKANRIVKLSELMEACGIDPGMASPEALVVYEAEDALQILLDEGDRCREAPDAQKSFRSLLIQGSEI